MSQQERSASTDRVTIDSSGNTFPAETVNAVTQRIDVPAYPQQLPAPRLQKEARRRRDRD